MTYAAILEAYGYQRFVADASEAGATSFILVDVPSDHRPDLQRVHLIAPTSTDDRIRLAATLTDDWRYVVSVTGTTGARDRVSTQLADLVPGARATAVGVPLYAGFGIGSPDQARAAARLVDGVIVGSRAVQIADHGPLALRDFAATLRAAIDTAA